MSALDAARWVRHPARMCGWSSAGCVKSLRSAAPDGRAAASSGRSSTGLRDKPASWLVLNANAALGQLTVWVSGEAQMDWGSPSDGGARHYDLASVDDLRRCVDDLEAALIGCR